MTVRPTYSGVVATLALLVATTGGAAVAAGLAKNSVGTKQLKTNAVVAAKVKDGSLQAADFAAGQLPAGPAGPAGARGAQGPAGPTGPTGATGAPGANAAAYLGSFNDAGIIPGYTCVSGNVTHGSFRAGDTAVLTPSYNAGVGFNVTVQAGRVLSGTSLPYTICNMSGTQVPSGAYRVDVWRVVGPLGARPDQLQATRVR